MIRPFVNLGQLDATLSKLMNIELPLVAKKNATQGSYTLGGSDLLSDISTSSY